jgi:hypothetical protein
MKKPLLLIGAGIIVLLVVVFVIAKAMNNQGSSTGGETSVSVLPESEWPAVSLTPTNDPQVKGSDGHWLDLNVEKINVPGAVSMDYLLVYSTTDGGQQGVPGTVKLTGGDIEHKLLLGSESSGKFRYDAGVSQGNITLTFRDLQGKTMGKVSSDFHLQSGVADLTSVDGVFTYTLSKIPSGVFFVTMKTLVQPSASSSIVIWQNGYGVFSSDGKPHAGSLAAQ